MTCDFVPIFRASYTLEVKLKKMVLDNCLVMPNSKEKNLAHLGLAVQGPEHWSKISVFLTFIPFFGDEKTDFETFKRDIPICDAILPLGPENQRNSFPSSPKIVFICLRKKCKFIYF